MRRTKGSHGSRRIDARSVLTLVGLLTLFLPAARPLGDDDDGGRRVEDPAGDAQARVTDPGATGIFDTDLHHLPDLLAMEWTAWQPLQPHLDLFEGIPETDESDADFFRIDLEFRGLINPPGLAGPSVFQPFRHGPHPLFGFVEIDMDDDVETGGEVTAPQYRYLGNVVRFGGRIDEDSLEGREALSAEDFDGDIETAPFFERSGEEFHLAFLGGEFSSSDIVRIAGDSDSIFEAGETWRIRAPWFHRAHAFEDFSFIDGGLLPGEYMPDVTIQFQHIPVLEKTVVSLVFPLTQEGAGLAVNSPPEPPDFDPTNQVSLEEALEDLVFSAQFLEKFPTGDPNERLIRGWAIAEIDDALEPSGWRLTALFGSSYLFPLQDGVFYVWSDIYPNVGRGDVDGDGEIDDDDVEKIEQYIETHDLDDAVADGSATIEGFAEDFSVYDVNHDGVVDGLDLLVEEADGDADDDEDFDLRDFARIQNCQGADTLIATQCNRTDLNLSGVTDRDDLPWFIQVFLGPTHP